MEALDLKLWAQLNLIGKVSYEEYLRMEPEEARACYLALKQAVDSAQAVPNAQASFEQHYQNVQQKLGGSGRGQSQGFF